MSLIEKGSKPSSKRVRRCDDGGEGVDRISQLHDDVLVHILSFLPLKEAAATSLVAPRWSQLWRYTPNLVFHNDSELDPEINIPITMPPGETCSFTRGSLKAIAWVNSVIDSHKALSLKQFALEFCLHDVQPLPKWLRFALSRSVEILKLDFEDTSCYDLDIDTDVFAGIQSSDFKFVKELTLRNFTVSGEAIELLVHNSPLLERLVLDVYLKSNLVIVGGTFKHFELLNRGRYDVSIKVSAPNLTRLRCCFDTSRLFLEDVPNLVDASFELMDGDTLDCLANSTSNLEILTILLHNPMAFSTPQMPKLRKLFLDYFSVNKEFRVPVTDLLQASPCLQEFRLKVTDDGWHYEDFTDGESIFEEPKLGKFPHRHLKVFEFSGFYFIAADHMELLRYIVDNCVALEEIIISPLLEAGYSKFRYKSSTKYPKSNTYKIRPSSYETYGNAVGSDECVVGSDERKNELRIKKLTGRMVAGKVPHHINLLIGHFVSRLNIVDFVTTESSFLV